MATQETQQQKEMRITEVLRYLAKIHRIRAFNPTECRSEVFPTKVNTSLVIDLFLNLQVIANEKDPACRIENDRVVWPSIASDEVKAMLSIIGNDYREYICLNQKTGFVNIKADDLPYEQKRQLREALQVTGQVVQTKNKIWYPESREQELTDEGFLEDYEGDVH